MSNWCKLTTLLAIGAMTVMLTAEGAHAASDGVIVVPSANNVQATADKLDKILRSKGVTVFARVDHAAGAKKVGKDLRPTVLLIFGNPKLGSPLMQKQQRFGLDLPMKALVYQAPDGKTYIAYNDPAYLSKRHGVSEPAKVLQKMTGALKKFTAAAAAK